MPNLPAVGLDPAGKPVVLKWGSQTTLLGITDGTSSTTLFGEKHIRPDSLRGKNEDRSVFGGNRNNVRRMMGVSDVNGDRRPLLTPDVQTDPLANSSFGGPHPGGDQLRLRRRGRADAPHQHQHRHPDRLREGSPADSGRPL